MSKARRAAQLLVMAVRAHRETHVHAVADRHVKPIAVVFRYAFAAARKQRTEDRIIKVLRKALDDTLPATLIAVLRDSGVETVHVLPRIRRAEVHALARPIMMRFDAKNPRVIAWARKHSAELISQVSDSTREFIREAVARSHETGASLVDAIAEAIGDDTRAEVIARTESMMAANEGQREAWRQAVDNGWLDESTRRQWIASSDACPECDALDGEEADLGGNYPNDGGEGPPLHPNCRCTEGIAGD